MATDGDRRIISVKLDEGSLAATTADAEHERRVAIFDLLEANDFRLVDGPPGPYRLDLSAPDGRLCIDVSLAGGGLATSLSVSLDPFRRVIKDYFMICESYYDAIRTATPDRIEAIDMGRRGLHNEGSELLAERLKGSAEFDFDTARRLFTLVCALHRPR